MSPHKQPGAAPRQALFYGIFIETRKTQIEQLAARNQWVDWERVNNRP